MMSFGPCTSVHNPGLCHSFVVCVCVCVYVCCRLASSQPRVRTRVLLAAKQARCILPFYELQLSRRRGRVCGWFLVLVACRIPVGQHSWPVVSQWPLSAEDRDPRPLSRVNRVEVSHDSLGSPAHSERSAAHITSRSKTRVQTHVEPHGTHQG